jgi:S-DNA-T family DNA segregation ATPase FtsK/SpoIIIE
MLESALQVIPLNLSDSMAKRVVALLREKTVIRGRGYAGYEFSFCDPVEEAEIEKERNEEISEEQILDAVRTISETMRASTSILQRKMKVGYNRAARLMDLLEQRAVIGPVVENLPREILMNLEQYQAVLDQSIGGEK